MQRNGRSADGWSALCSLAHDSWERKVSTVSHDAVAPGAAGECAARSEPVIDRPVSAAAATRPVATPVLILRYTRTEVPLALS